MNNISYANEYTEADEVDAVDYSQSIQQQQHQQKLSQEQLASSSDTNVLPLSQVSNSRLNSTASSYSSFNTSSFTGPLYLNTSETGLHHHATKLASPTMSDHPARVVQVQSNSISLPERHHINTHNNGAYVSTRNNDNSSNTVLATSHSNNNIRNKNIEDVDKNAVRFANTRKIKSPVPSPQHRYSNNNKMGVNISTESLMTASSSGDSRSSSPDIYGITRRGNAANYIITRNDDTTDKIAAVKSQKSLVEGLRNNTMALQSSNPIEKPPRLGSSLAMF
jgi:hypothetical protein